MNEADLLRVSRKLLESGFSMQQAAALAQALQTKIDEERGARSAESEAEPRPDLLRRPARRRPPSAPSARAGHGPAWGAGR